jgi:hypothetical protein
MLEYVIANHQVVCCRICNYILAIKLKRDEDYEMLVGGTVVDHYTFAHAFDGGTYINKTSHYYG